MPPDEQREGKRPAGDAGASRAEKHQKREADATEEPPTTAQSQLDQDLQAEPQAEPQEQVQQQEQAQAQEPATVQTQDGASAPAITLASTITPSLSSSLSPPLSHALLEDRISPKDVIGAAALDAVFPSPVPLLPLPARRRRASSRPPSSNLLRADIDALLPGSAFGHSSFVFANRFWTVKDEQALRREWNDKDEAALRAGNSPSDAEIDVWNVMRDLFQCSPPDLFRYGLKYEGPLAEDESGGDAPFWQQLLQLLPHPMWAGDVAVLRYALQRAVMHRIGVRSHICPMVPPWSRTEPTFVRWTRESAAAAGEQPEREDPRRSLARIAGFRSLTQIKRKNWMEKLDLCMGHMAPFYDKHEDVPAVERFLFMLRQQDLELLAEALDATYDRLPPEPDDDGNIDDENMMAYYYSAAEDEDEGSRKRPQVLDSFWSYWKGLPAATRSRRDKEWVVGEKRLAIIAERREAVIRRRIERRQDDRFLLDIPPFDPDPDYHLYPNMREQILLVVRGLRAPPRTHQWVKERWAKLQG